jgi:DNA-binding transcriptional regulator YiaG
MTHLNTSEFLTDHYGALEGLDFMAGCDATVTFMDPRPNLGDEELRAAFLGLDPSGRLDQLAAAELQQAHGRLRTIHRQRPGRQLHVGAVVPAGWAGLDVRVEGLRVGRPRHVAAMSPEEFCAARAVSGLSQAAFARSIRCGLSAVKHYEAGRAPVPEDVARAVRAIMSDGSETPREKVS